MFRKGGIRCHYVLWRFGGYIVNYKCVMFVLSKQKYRYNTAKAGLFFNNLKFITWQNQEETWSHLA
jgi:hypothetical protein